MKAQRPVGLNLKWPWITAVFVADVAILIAASHSPESWQGPHRIASWVGVGLVVLTTLPALVTYRGVTVVQRIAASLKPGPALTAGCAPAIDHQRRFGRQPIGVREHATNLVGVVEVDGPVRVRTVADALCQFDIRLEGVDVVSVQATGDKARTCLIVRMDPRRTVAAVAVRDSLASTLTVAIERLAAFVGGRPLTAGEIDDLDEALLAGLEPSSRRPKDLGAGVSSFWVTPRDITTDNLQQLLRTDAEVTVATVRLAATRSGRPRISACVRYHSGQPLAAEVCRGLNRLTGRQVAAVRASLPAPSSHPVLTLPYRTFEDGEHIVVTSP